MHPKDAEGIANSVDPDQTRSSLIWVCTVCPDLSVRKLRKITVFFFPPIFTVMLKIYKNLFLLWPEVGFCCYQRDIKLTGFMKEKELYEN